MLPILLASCAFQIAPMLRHGGISATTTAITPVMADENYFEADVMPSSPALMSEKMQVKALA